MPKNILYFSSLQECNEKCLFCVRGGKEKPIRYLTTDECKKRIKEAAQEGWKSIRFDGGEPTLRNDLIELLDSTKKYGFEEIGILTNAVKLADRHFTEEITNIFKKRNGRRIKFFFGVSLHSHKKEISEYLVDTPDTFEKTIRGIQNLVDLGVYMSIYHIMTKYNYKDLPSFVDFLHTKFPQIRNLTFSFIYPAGAALQNQHIFPRLSDLELYLYEAMERTREYKINFSISTCGTIPLCYLKGYEIYTINQQRMDQPENIGLVDSGQKTRYKLATKKFHRETKLKSSRCSLCLLNKLCSGIWRVYVERYSIEELKPVTDKTFYKTVRVDLKNIEKIKRSIINYKNIFFLDFKFREFNRREFMKLVHFVEWLKDHNLNYIIKRPFSYIKKYCKTLPSSLGIPQSCRDCLDLFEVARGKVYFCNGAEGNNFKTYKDRAELFSDFKKSRENRKNKYYKKCWFRNLKNKQDA